MAEEFVASKGFASWFLSQLGLSGAVEIHSVARSVSTANGETDVEVGLELDGSAVTLLIENKVDAILQPRQAERYQERARDYLERKSAARVITVLLAPLEYFGKDRGALGFDRRVTLQSVLEWFERNADLGERRMYKVTLLRGAVERGGTGWSMVPDAHATGFWRQYWLTTERLAPHLAMPEPDEKPATSCFVFFKPASLPRDIVLVHKMAYGNVDLQFAGMGDDLTTLRTRFAHRLEPEMRIERAAKSGVVRIRVPKIDLESPFSASAPVIEASIEAAARLLRWYELGSGPR